MPLRWNVLGTLSYAAVAAWPSTGLSAGAAADEAFQKEIFGRALSGGASHACFKRAYDGAHLAQHPQQNVRVMRLLVTGRGEDPAAPSYTLDIDVSFRRSGTHFQTAGDCGSIGETGKAGIVTCGVDCDGGTIGVELKTAKSVLVAIPDGARIWKAGSDSEDNDESKRFGADDKLFRLDRTALTDCLPLAADEADKTAMKRGE